MKRPQLRLSTILWLVAIAAAFLGGIRYEEQRQRAVLLPTCYLEPAPGPISITTEKGEGAEPIEPAPTP